MSLHYLLDGYNILKQIPAFNDVPLEDGRKGLTRWIENARPAGSVNNTVTVVFDGPAFGPAVGGTFGGTGHPDFFGASPQGLTRVIFSQGSADDTIKRMVEEDQERRTCVVVSDDKDIVLYARALGSSVMSVRKFTKSLRAANPLSKSGKTARGESNSGGKYISLSRQAKINKELSAIWLKEKQ